MQILFFYKKVRLTFKHEILVPQSYNYGKGFVYKYSPCIICEKIKDLVTSTCEKLKLNSQTPKLRFFVLCFGFNQ